MGRPRPKPKPCKEPVTIIVCEDTWGGGGYHTPDYDEKEDSSWCSGCSAGYCESCQREEDWYDNY